MVNFGCSTPLARFRSLLLVLLACLLVIVTGAACGRKAATAPLPPDDGTTAGPGLALLPTPPLVPAVPIQPRHTSANQAPLTSSEIFAHDNGGQTGPGQGGAYKIQPGGEEILGWAVYQVPLTSTDRPTELGASIQKIQPGGEEILGFWVAAYSFSQQRWEFIGPDGGSPARWSSDGTLGVVLNSLARRGRYCNLGDGVSVQSYFAVIVEPHARGFGAGLNVAPGTVSFLPKSDQAYLKTEPLPSNIDGIVPDSTSTPPSVSLFLSGGQEAEELHIERAMTSGSSSAKRASNSGFVEIGVNDPADLDYVDPADNPGQANPPGLGGNYEYRVIAVTRDGNTVMRAAPANVKFGKLSEWTVFPLSTLAADKVSLAIIQGNPAVAYTDTTNGARLVYQRASSSDGKDPADWIAPIMVEDVSNDVGWLPDLEQVNGSPAICYVDRGNQQVHYAQSTTNDGMGEFDWLNRVTVSLPSDEPWYNSMTIVNGNPAIAYYDGSALGKNLLYVRSTTPDGASAVDWNQRCGVDTTGDTGLYCSLATINGDPALAWFNQTDGLMRYARSTTATGSQTTDWGTVVTFASGGHGITLLDVGGNPAISSCNSANDTQCWFRSTTANGDLLADWSQQVLFSNAQAFAAEAGGNAALIGGLPMIAFYSIDDETIQVVSATTATGGDSNDWFDHAPTGLAGFDFITMVNIGGHAAIAYPDSATSKPMFAITN
jgi:hypothetical protein